ncbi:lipase maturation factor family protein [Mycolicibacterium mucogenicum]|uniref:Lipase maturation factor family protein n=1 Tax=Mycolicibacterium mucogenicum DSM 44124 TaxID=1226753 RepID=A0A8H2PJ30_MYCMU|nr:lipase maturation factor family protein [Mycolicibacterium mucogenicum]KAB7752350.1 membrane protein [Mycolicibacterium mucogenicum DSM 44124]QPG68839.1 lipase maturation factor family protein [Mycolicibacterium mucogenicum DSM 44124]
MDWFTAPEYWFSRLVLERGIAGVYLIAFLCAARQFRALLGAQGMLPIPRYLSAVSFRQAPSIFHWHYSDRFFATVAWSGAALSTALVAGAGDVVPLWAAMLLWLLLWVLYLSIVNVGQRWYAFGWESLLLEAGFLAVFLGNDSVAPPVLVIWLARWLVFRTEFGAGLIKLRGDRCWRDLTCLYYHHETQPMPGPLSWFFHHLPRPLHRVEVAVNHVTQLVVPFGLFAPQPVATVAAAIVVVTQLWLVISGNYAWLNWLTMVLAFSAIAGPAPGSPLPAAPPTWFVVLVIGFSVLVVVLSYWPVRNLLSPRQRMNASFDPLHLVNTYGAFGSIGRIRREVVIEGTADPDITDETVWQEYEFKGKPGAVGRLPRQWAPYHLRLDWLMWFAAISPTYGRQWFVGLLERLLRGDAATLKLLRHNPFPGSPPKFVRARIFRYRYATPHELRHERVWWHRTPEGEYFPPVTLPD